MPDKKIELKPENAFYFWQIVAAILLIPVLGIGVYLLYRIRKKRKSITYIITDFSITAKSETHSENIDLVNITDIDVSQGRTEKRFHIGTLHIKTASRRLNLEGLKNPRALAGMILKAAEAERTRLEKINADKRKEPETHPGSLEKLDYLTGLWQQGLLSDEDFLKEKKHFEP